MALPNVKVNVNEESLVTSNTTIPFVPALIIKAKSGPIGTIETITSESQFKAMFGESDYTVPSAYALQVYLRSYSYAFVTRVANTTNASYGTATLTFKDISDNDVSLVSVTTVYKTDLYNGKEIKLVYDSTNKKLWFDLSSLTGRNTISIKENYDVSTATAVDLSTVLTNLANSVNSAKLGITMTNLYVDKVVSDPVPTSAQLTGGLNFNITEGDSGNESITNATVKSCVDLYDSDSMNIDVMVIPEFTDAEVVNYASSLALKNKFLVITSPNVSTVAEAKTAVNSYESDNQGSLAIYFPNVYYNNLVDNVGNDVVIPVSMAVLSVYARTDSLNKWATPAGTTRGKLNLVKDLVVDLSDEDLTELYDNTIPLNGIKFISGQGFIVWGNKTTSSDSSFFDRINVSRLVKYVAKQAYAISWDYLFEPINDTVFNGWTIRMGAVLDSIEVNNGLDDYRIVMDSSINTEETIANNQLNAIIKIKPTEVAEYVTIDLTVTDTVEVTVETE